MSDAWEILTAKATDTTDAWAALNSQQSSNNVPGMAIDELRFVLQPIMQLSGAIGISVMSGSVGSRQLSGVVSSRYLSGQMGIIGLTGSIAVKEI